MGRVVALVFAVLLVALGLLWTLHGLGYLKGSSSGGQEFLSVLGPAVAGFGVALALVAVRRR